MNIYLITRKDLPGYDEFDSFAVASTDARSARAFANDAAGSYDNCNWASANDAKCRKVGTASPGVKAGILVGSFNAG